MSKFRVESYSARVDHNHILDRHRVILSLKHHNVIEASRFAQLRFRTIIRVATTDLPHLRAAHPLRKQPPTFHILEHFQLPRSLGIEVTSVSFRLSSHGDYQRCRSSPFERPLQDEIHYDQNPRYPGTRLGLQFYFEPADSSFSSFSLCRSRSLVTPANMRSFSLTRW